MANNPYISQLRKTLRGTPLAPYAQLIARMETKHKLPKGLLAGIAKAESSFGTEGDPVRGFNAWGWTNGGPPNFRTFPNWQTAIRQYARFLSEDYVSQGMRTPEQMERRYVGYAAPHWVKNVRSVMGQFGGGVPTVTNPGRTPRSRAPQESKKDILPLLFQLFAMRQSGASSSSLMPLVLMYASRNNAPDPQGAPPPRGTPGGRGPSTVVPMYRRGKGFLLPSPGFRTDHDTSNLAGYPANDFMIPDGTPVYADFSGKVTELSGHDGYSNGFGGRSYYITTSNGRKTFLTHFDYKRTLLKVGQTIRKGQLLGYVIPGAGHIHYGYG